MSPIKKLLIANRGEIALRIMRTCREMGIKTVAVFSEADRHALHVRYADEAVCIGPAASSESYLRGDKIIEVCKKLNVDAIHPGYGFLSENAKFSQAVKDAGLIFVGPSAHSIEIMGDKLSAKRAAARYNIPMVPGTPDAVTDRAEAKVIASQIGYPILIKASAGGGGKGMRIVENEAEFDEQMERAVSEAISSFGDGAVFVEKYVASPRHIEIQLLADQQGNTIYLFERECSVQRRHQKVVEEAPSSCLTPQIRAAMGECAVNVARSCGYYGAGTVEFIVDDKLDFYFLEMNTRLQVEHPVSEMITGVDLVRQMIYVAEGRTLEIKQEDLQINGHAVEVRVYAEDPANNFLPDVGTLQTYVRPQGNGVRVDDGFEQGMAIPIYYDPMIAKLITHAATRQEAIDKMVRAIDEYQITGVQTTLGFCRFVLQHEAFTSGQFDTHFVKHYFTPAVLKGQTNETEEKIVAALVGHLLQETKKTSNASSTITAQKSKWKANRS
ncbi:MAG: acetyl-CoA carboxylase biotin carboxylase subunit [Runella slithyformis]|nr:MAG: acetyl-CoA carboxylase biotin carboxylase subunit [Runella slithyformis]TAF96703.1 MAG: acetyl-CoA carboxylase biotin carboxylase subunit [Runella sp.]TAG21091.1 MAG: acetyl-CoA carboxylase biotin carboxylase subunit [Cytophagales bacterium]TAG40177.1 MAG: acetyl-CoA carboxylase biotin carboxylase subunit [Cytophagia bacterium]TAF27586.1 MAG: acetyl-CoA carboxylase biotin carboxylase subunit [Runella slithyformis]